MPVTHNDVKCPSCNKALGCSGEPDQRNAIALSTGACVHLKQTKGKGFEVVYCGHCGAVVGVFSN